jgi:heme-degrading protein
LCISVVGPSGDLVYFERSDNCQFGSISISQHKARAAARYHRPTVVFERLLGKGPYFSYLATLDEVIASRGGNPLVVGGKVIGTIGCEWRYRLARRHCVAGRHRRAEIAGCRRHDEKTGAGDRLGACEGACCTARGERRAA